MNAKDLLKKVLELFSDPAKWAKGDFAFDVNKNSCGIHSGCCWCLLGALTYLSPDEVVRQGALILIRQTLFKRGDWLGVANFNDYQQTTIEDVRNLLREAISHAEDLELAA